jgi:hypothetical protein
MQRRIEPFVRRRAVSAETESVEWSSGDDTITGYRVARDEGSVE